MVADEAADGVFQFPGGAVDAAAELLVGEQSEPAFDQVEPAGRSGSEVQVEARAFGQPVADQLRLVGAVVVQDQVNVQLGRHVAFDGVEEAAKLHGAMAALGLTDQGAGFSIQRGKQTGGAVTGIIVGAAFDLAGRMGSSGAVRSSA
jgi:hypothetical protein